MGAAETINGTDETSTMGAAETMNGTNETSTAGAVEKINSTIVTFTTALAEAINSTIETFATGLAEAINGTSENSTVGAAETINGTNETSTTGAVEAINGRLIKSTNETSTTDAAETGSTNYTSSSAATNNTNDTTSTGMINSTNETASTTGAAEAGSSESEKSDAVDLNATSDQRLGATPERLGDEEPPCSFCGDSGFHGFSVCNWCDGIPKPVKEKTLSTELVIKRQTSTQFLMLESSAEHSEDSTSTLVDQECKLCAADVASIVLRPCGHGGFCEDCARRLTGARSTAFCPYCRASIQAFLKIDPKREISCVHEEFQVNVSHWIH
jgi:hypothetical protein